MSHVPIPKSELQAQFSLELNRIEQFQRMVFFRDFNTNRNRVEKSKTFL